MHTIWDLKATYFLSKSAAIQPLQIFWVTPSFGEKLGQQKASIKLIQATHTQVDRQPSQENQKPFSNHSSSSAYKNEHFIIKIQWATWLKAAAVLSEFIS